MVYIRLTLLGVLGLSILNASSENVPSVDDHLETAAKTSVALHSIALNTSNLTPQYLKNCRHQLRMRLMPHRRTPSVAPPEGEKRRQIESKLSEIDRLLSQNP